MYIGQMLWPSAILYVIISFTLYTLHILVWNDLDIDYNDCVIIESVSIIQITLEIIRRPKVVGVIHE